jgi:hypothetical protein
MYSNSRGSGWLGFHRDVNVAALERMPVFSSTYTMCSLFGAS